MIRWTTPTLAFLVPEPSILGCNVYVTLEQKGRVLTMNDPDVELTEDETGVSIEVHLTQEQTAGFKFREPVKVQVNWIDQYGERNATVEKEITVYDNLLKEVIEYGSS